MIRQTTVLRDYYDGVINGVIVLRDSSGYWTGYRYTEIKNNISQLYSLDMRVRNRQLGGIAYEVNNSILYAIFYCVKKGFDDSLFKQCYNKFLTHHKEIMNTDINEKKYAIVLPSSLSQLEVDRLNQYIENTSQSFYLYPWHLRAATIG